jgi:RNA polymerase sigma-70 factor (sigma-E family)
VCDGPVSGTDARPSFEEYVAARGASLWRSAWLLTGDAHRAEDLVQATLLKCWRRWRHIDSGAALDSYVRRVMVTTYTDWWRRRWRGEVPTEVLPEETSPDATTALSRDVLAALAALPRGQRAVVVLRFYDDLSMEQTAAALGVSTGTVKSQTSRALASLRLSAHLQEMP